MYTRNVNMKLKAAAFIVLAFLAVPFASFAQSPSSLTVTDSASDSILVLSNEETGVPGYVHQKYAFNCFGQLKLDQRPHDSVISLSFMRGAPIALPSAGSQGC